MKNAIRLIIAVGLWLGSIASLRAHVIDAVEFEFQAEGREWRLLGEMDIAFMLPETRGVPDGLPLSRARTLQAPPEELARIRKETENTLRKLLRLSFGGKDVPWRITFPDFETQPFDLPVDAGDTALVSVKITADALPGPGELRAHWTDDFESEFIAVNDEAGGAVVTASSGASTVLLRVDGAGEIAKPETRMSEWIVSGFRHVVPLGLDHLLFIIGLFLLMPKWKPLMAQSLLFTLAHSITLALAVLGWVTVPSKPVEIFIAASIAWIGIENLIAKDVEKVGKVRLVVVFLFGLVHGLGFAGVLAEKLGGIPKDGLVKPLVGFNIGVELAQVSVLAVAFLALWPVRRWTRQIRIAGSVIIVLAGIGWVIERLFFGA